MPYLPRASLPALFDALQGGGYQVFAPVLADGHLAFEVCQSPAQMTEGLHIHESPGHFTFDVDDSPRLFAWAKGPQSLKSFLFAPEEPLWEAENTKASSISASRNPLTSRLRSLARAPVIWPP